MTTINQLPATITPLRSLRLARVAFYLALRTYQNALALEMPKSACDKYADALLRNAQHLHTLTH